jgi:hypothetical protein
VPLGYPGDVNLKFEGRNDCAKDYIGIEAGIALTEAIANGFERGLGVKDTDKTVTDD